MTLSPKLPKLEVGHVITIFTVIVQGLMVIAVLNWRVGSLERRMDTMDERLWQHMQVQPKPASYTPPDAARWVLTRN